MEGSTPLSVDDPSRQEVEDVVVRFAGDSGDGVQITGGQFTLTTHWPETISPLFQISPRKSGPPPAPRLGSLLFRYILDLAKSERLAMRQMCWSLSIPPP